MNQYIYQNAAISVVGVLSATNIFGTSITVLSGGSVYVNPGGNIIVPVSVGRNMAFNTDTGILNVLSATIEVQCDMNTAYVNNMSIGNRLSGNIINIDNQLTLFDQTISSTHRLGLFGSNLFEADRLVMGDIYTDYPDDARGLLTINGFSFVDMPFNTDPGDSERIFVINNAMSTTWAGAFATTTMQVGPRQNGEGRCIMDFKVRREADFKWDAQYVIGGTFGDQNAGLSYRDYFALSPSSAYIGGAFNNWGLGINTIIGTQPSATFHLNGTMLVQSVARFVAGLSTTNITVTGQIALTNPIQSVAISTLYLSIVQGNLIVNGNISAIGNIYVNNIYESITEMSTAIFSVTNLYVGTTATSVLYITSNLPTGHIENSCVHYVTNSVATLTVNQRYEIRNQNNSAAYSPFQFISDSTYAQMVIGNNYPANLDNNMLVIKQMVNSSSGDYDNKGIRVESANSTDHWNISFEDGIANLVFAYNGTNVGYVSNVGSGQMNFTGQHHVPTAIASIATIDSATFANYYGMIVRSTGVIQTIDAQNGSVSRGQLAISIDEAVPTVDFTSMTNCKSAFGVIAGIEEANSTRRLFDQYGFVIAKQKHITDRRIIVNSLGEGAIWVTDYGGNIENGDYITTCSVIGMGRRQADDLLHNYTVAKATIDCNFVVSSADYSCVDMGSYRKALIACVYEF